MSKGKISSVSLKSQEPTEYENLEDLLNYDEGIDKQFKALFEDRKILLADKYRTQEILLDQFPGWNIAVMERMKSTFEVFDISADGLIDFDEFCEILDDFGDNSGTADRRFHFEEADFSKNGALEFEEFLYLMYHLTMTAAPGGGGISSTSGGTSGSGKGLSGAKSTNLASKSGGSSGSAGSSTGSGSTGAGTAPRPPPAVAGPSSGGSGPDVYVPQAFFGPSSTGTSGGGGSFESAGSGASTGSEQELDLLPLGNSLRQIDRNMSRLRSLDVVQQLEAGVF